MTLWPRPSHAGVVQVQLDRTDHRPGEAIRDHVGLPSHVLDVRGELGNVGELALLAVGPRLCRLGHGVCERLVVHVGRKLAAFQQKTEASDREPQPEELPVEGAVPALPGRQLAAVPQVRHVK